MDFGRAWLVCVMLGGCGPSVGGLSAEDSSTDSSGSAQPGTEVPGEPVDHGSSGGDSTEPDPALPDVGSDDGPGFISDPDGGPVGFECSVWEQDCEPGEKCAWYANDGGNAWNATRCVPLSPTPDAIGEVCDYEGIDTGIDSCGVGSICWDVDPGTQQGQCVSHCIGSESEPTCPGSGTTCSVSSSGFSLCLPNCDPLTQDCGEGETCIGVDQRFICAPQAGSAERNEPCEAINGCVSGLACIPAPRVADCDGGSAGCCSPYCLVGDDSTCAVNLGETCTPWYPDGAAPPASEHVGVCALVEA